MRALLLWSVALVAGGCGTEQADQGSLLAVVPTSSVTVQNVSYVTNVEPAAAAAVTEPSPEVDDPPLPPPPVAAPTAAAPPVVRPPDPGCVPDDVACLEAACTRGSARGCEARGDVYQETDDLRALAFYRRAVATYSRECDGGDADACRDFRRMSAPGYGAHTYHAPPGCPDGYAMSVMGCIVAGATSGPVGTTVVVNGNHNVVQVFGGAAKVVGHSGKKTKDASPGSAP